MPVVKFGVSTRACVGGVSARPTTGWFVLARGNVPEAAGAADVTDDTDDAGFDARATACGPLGAAAAEQVERPAVG